MMRPKKKWGQHFLTRPEIGIQIADFAGITPSDTVVEIGAGTGVLTAELVRRAARVIAFEIDSDLIPVLQDKFRSFSNVEIISGDFMKTGPDRLKELPNFKVVANIPYNLTTPIIFLLLDFFPRLELMVMTIQKEVAQRLAAKIGTKEYGALTLSAGLLAQIELVKIIKKGAFRPPPRVESAVIRISAHPKPLLEPDEIQPFLKLVHSVFGQRRKTILNQLAKYLEIPKNRAEPILAECGIDSLRRPETISREEYIRLLKKIGGADNSTPPRFL